MQPLQYHNFVNHGDDMATQAKPEAVEHVKYWPVEATIWKFSRDGIVSFAVTVQKNYKEGEGKSAEYKSTDFIDERFTPLASKALNDAHTRIQALRAESSDQS